MLESQITYDIHTELPITALFNEKSNFPKYLTFSNKANMTVISLFPNRIDQEEIEEIAELVSNAMNQPKMFGEIYDLMYCEEDCVLNIHFR